MWVAQFSGSGAALLWNAQEQLFHECLSPSSHVFLMCSILYHHNERVNQQALEGLKTVFNGNITLDSQGKAILGIYFILSHFDTFL